MTPQEILNQRAAILARPQKDKAMNKTTGEFVRFSFDNESFAIESKYIQEVFPATTITPLPHSPPFLLGLLNIRRKIVAAIDLKVLLEMPGHAKSAGTSTIIVSDQQKEFAFFVDGIGTCGDIEREGLMAPTAHLHGFQREILFGISKEHLIVINGEKLLYCTYQLIEELG